MAISGLSAYQIIRCKDLKLGENYTSTMDVIPDKMLVTSQMFTYDWENGTYTFIGPSLVYPNDNQCVTADMFGDGPITGYTVNINITIVGNVYISGITSSSLSAATNANYQYIVPGGYNSSAILSYIPTWSGTTNKPIFAISGGTTTHSDLLYYNQLNQVNSNYNRFQLSHLSGTVHDDYADIYINNADVFKIGTIPAGSNRKLTLSYSGEGPGIVSRSSFLYLKQRTGTVTGILSYGTPGISTKSTTASTYYVISKDMVCELLIHSSPMLSISLYDNGEAACDVKLTSEVRTLSKQHLTKTIDLMLISPIFHITDE